MLVLIVILAIFLVTYVAHSVTGKAVIAQEITQGENSDALYVCIPGTGPCNAWPFNAIRDRVLLKTGDVMYVKYPEKWFSFDLSKKAMARIIKEQSDHYSEIRFIAGSLGAKIVVGAETLLDDFDNCRLTNYLVSPSFGPGDVRWIEMFRSKFGSDRYVTQDPYMDRKSQNIVEQDAMNHKQLFLSQLLASIESVNSEISPEIKTFIIASEGDWLTNTQKASKKFGEKIGYDFEVTALPLKTHCEFIKEAHIYCDYFESALSE